MNKNTAVEVFLGKPIEVPSEQQFLARLQRDLQTLSVPARILANLQVGRLGDRQIDFVVITTQRTVLIELKTYPGQIVSGPRNGPWQVKVGVEIVDDRRNPLEQALTASQFFSDELHAFAKRVQVPGPTRRKFYSDVDAVACVYPDVRQDSNWEPIKHVELIGYVALLDRLQKPGPSLQWASEDWDRFVQQLNLYRADEDAPENVLRAAGAAAIDAYVGLYREAHAALGPIAETAVLIDSTPAGRPDAAGMLAAGATMVLRGQSGTGKTLWARAISLELAEAGHVPIWIEPDMCDDTFLMACAQAIAPYTAIAVNDLIKAADVAGRSVVFIVDDFNKIKGQRRLLDGLRTIRVRAFGRGVLTTGQDFGDAEQLGQPIEVELLIPDDEGRRSILASYGHPELIDRCDAFITPLELSLAARCADDLRSEPGHAELFDTYVDKLVLGDPVIRGALRSVAAHMFSELRPSVPRGEVTRMLRRELKATDDVLQRVFECPLLAHARARISFRHEQFEQFLAAEALLLSEPDPIVLGRRLNSPTASYLRGDVIALESDRSRLETLLQLSEDPMVLVSAAHRRLGHVAAEVVRGVFADALGEASATTIEPGVALRTVERVMGASEWVVPNPPTATQIARLEAIGRLLAEGIWIEGVDVLLRHTDRLCAEALNALDPDGSEVWASQIFAATYVLAPSTQLPATSLVKAATEHYWIGSSNAENVSHVIDRLLPDGEEPGLGALQIAGHLLRSYEVPLRIDVITECVNQSAYHLRLTGLHLAEDRTGRLTAEERQTVISQIEALETRNVLLGSATIETLAALGGVEPINTEEDIESEIKTALSMKGDPFGEKLAYGIVTSQFENEIVGPYYQVVSTLPPEQHLQLLAMALNGGGDGWVTESFILEQFKDLRVPEVMDAVERYIARFDPGEPMSVQHAMQGYMRAITLFVRADLAIPGSTLADPDPAWASVTKLICAAAGDDDRALTDAWDAFAVEHPNSVASFISKLRSVGALADDRTLLDRLESSIPASAVDALIQSLNHPERMRSIGRFDFDLGREIVMALGKFGGRTAIEPLRRFTDDPDIGEAATTAVRTIQARVA